MIKERDDKDLKNRGFILYFIGYLLLGSIHHKQYGIATYVREDMNDAETISKSFSDNVFILVTRLE